MKVPLSAAGVGAPLPSTLPLAGRFVNAASGRRSYVMGLPYHELRFLYGPRGARRDRQRHPARDERAPDRSRPPPALARRSGATALSRSWCRPTTAQSVWTDRIRSRNWPNGGCPAQGRKHSASLPNRARGTSPVVAVAPSVRDLALPPRQMPLQLCPALEAMPCDGIALDVAHATCARRSESEPKCRSVFDPPWQCRRSVTEAAANGEVQRGYLLNLRVKVPSA